MRIFKLYTVYLSAVYYGRQAQFYQRSRGARVWASMPFGPSDSVCESQRPLQTRLSIFARIPVSLAVTLEDSIFFPPIL